MVPSHQPLRTLPSDQAYLDDADTMLGVPVEPPAMQRRIHMTPPHGLRLICPLSLLINVEMTLEVPTPPLVVADNNMVEALRAELAKCKVDHEWELKLVCMEHVNEVRS